MRSSLRAYFIVGELSGDALGADLMDHFSARVGSFEAIGLGGTQMRERGLVPLFDSSEIAVMGITGVLARLPSLLARVNRVARDIVEKAPDIVLLVDSPEFAKLVAKKVKKQRPDLPFVKYVCPSVWAWRPGRAPKMNAYLDHVLAILPFEPELMAELGGPPTTYVGHPLARLSGKTDLSAKTVPGLPAQVLLLPGSRKSETSRLLPILRDTAKALIERGAKCRFVMPAVSHLEAEIRADVQAWETDVEIVGGEDAKWSAMKHADLAIAASGTVLLELAMLGVPAISIYKPDPALNAIRFLIKGWTGALPNLIADKVIIPERFNEYAHPGYIARLAEVLMCDSHERRAQLEGYALVHERMRQDRPPGELAAQTVLDLLEKRQG